MSDPKSDDSYDSPTGPLLLRARTPGAVSAHAGALGQRPCVIVEIDPTERRGAISSTDGETIAEAARLALRNGLPLVSFIASSGSDITEGISSLYGWGVAARAIVDCSGVVPILMIVTGPAVSGPALLLGLADHVIMIEDTYAFVSGPAMVTEFTGVPIDSPTLGGASVHARSSGTASILAANRTEAVELLTLLLSYLPSNSDELPPRSDCSDPVDRSTPEAGELLPTSNAGSYDIRSMIAIIADHGEYLELRDRWATNLVTAFGTIGGRTVGFVGNQPQSIAGTLDIPASQKAARFVAFCDAFNIPLVTLVDTPGFYPGKDLEWRGMIRHGAQLVFAYARATVPRICVILRKSYGGAYIVMDSKRMGNDICLAWPTAELAVMGAKQAAEILNRGATADERAAFESDYEQRLLNPYVAAERGYVDDVIDPADTRIRVAAALDMLSTKRERLQYRKHDNTPL